MIYRTRFKSLCKLYKKYTCIMKCLLENANAQNADAKLREIDSILRNIENYPISWDFYKNQSIKFSQEFENLIIFCNELNI